MSSYTPPDPDYPTGLIDRLKPKLTTKIIKEIALSDFGFVSRGYREVFQQFIDLDRIPRPLSGDPREAFNITRWWSPESHLEHEISRLSLREAHVARAFSCACLLCTIDEEREEPEDSIPQLVESCHAIDPELLQDARDVIEWVEAYKNPPSVDPDRIVHDYIVITECAKLIITSMLGESDDRVLASISSIMDSGPKIIQHDPQNAFKRLETNGNWIYAEVLKTCTARDTWTTLAQRWLTQPPKNWKLQTHNAVIELGKLMLPA